ncbi:bis(5'-nucleosyl)-tetraphosphatase PrpE [Alteribacillus sp. HJP-4]|uniref:bis(5'-nucleosyl)-tetraphosphatase PrpE n=1 Tax=Alteribacillus sp. HJP-4 TaxID=2775394 RepID=UPI0035CD2640
MTGLDIIGDVHGCFNELTALLKKSGYERSAGSFKHPDNRTPVFIGDLTDRGPASVRTMQLVTSMVFQNRAKYVPGNHCNKLYRYFLGRNVVVNHGLETTVAELEKLGADEFRNIKADFMRLYEEAPLYTSLYNDKLIAVHAGLPSHLIGRSDKAVQRFALYGDITGEKNPDGTPVRRDWAQHYDGVPLIVYGHTPVKEPRTVGKTVNIDTGCVFGGKLTMLHFPEVSYTQVASSQPFVPEKFRSFDA